MNGGRVEQVGTPREVYDRPQSAFVASFVGDNNLFEGRVVGRDGDRLAVDVGGTVLDVAVDGAHADRPTVGVGVTFAVRPERLRTLTDGAAEGADEPNRLHTEVVRSEFLGETTRVWLDWEGTELTARTDEALDGRVTLAFAAADAHLVSVDGERSERSER
jgi:thiamine transport system ATP-binding protein